MNHSKKLKVHLDRLIDLRDRELEQRQVELGKKQALCARYENNIARLEQLGRAMPAPAKLCPTQVLNSVAYQQSVLSLAQRQRDELQLHRLELGRAREAVHAVSRQQEVYGLARDQVQTGLSTAARRLHQQQQDELATQVWLRGR